VVAHAWASDSALPRRRRTRHRRKPSRSGDQRNHRRGAPRTSRVAGREGTYSVRTSGSQPVVLRLGSVFE